ncbi:unnamed protein product [Clonostachys solani]|uniref:Fumarylacetoacetase-like C-terminal domain-containing protein n=1 Tax=Clonostachys solani TaxID=160281 RepID=A0A9N9ZM71_9HYPO|nr:unnamed protein product [Clonostachys solani]
MAHWTHIAHFEAEDGKKYFASIKSESDVARLSGLSVTGFSSFLDLVENGEGYPVTIKQVLAPVPYNGDIICIGLNYRKHAEEANVRLQLTVPLDPVMWYKPRRALRGPGQVVIPKVAADNFPDFEVFHTGVLLSHLMFEVMLTVRQGELVIVTSKDALNVSIEDAPGYILGYTVGNDLTARGYQDPKRGGQQFTRCKAFDGFAPLGPVLANAQSFGDTAGKRIVTKVNGKVFQDSYCDLINDAATLVSFLSQGTTLPAGSMIMTGSPPGIGYFSNPQYQLRDGDVVSVEIGGIGTLLNTMVFE